MNHLFGQLSTFLTLLISKDLEMLKMRCIRASRYLVKLRSALNAIRAVSKAKNALIVECADIVEHVMEYCGKLKNFDPASLVEAGKGLMKAVNRFDFNCNAKFKSYAKVWIKHQLLAPPKRRPKKPKQQPKSPEPYFLNEIGLTEILKLSTGSKEPPIIPKDPQTRISNIYHVLMAFLLLSAKEERIIRLRCCRPIKSLREIGLDFGLTKERIRQILLIANKKLKEYNDKLLNNTIDASSQAESTN